MKQPKKRPAPPLTPKRVAQNRAGHERRDFLEKKGAEFNGWESMSTIVKYIYTEAQAGRAVLPKPCFHGRINRANCLHCREEDKK